MPIRLEGDLRKRSLRVKIVPIEVIAKVMGLYAEKVDNLPKSCVDLFCRHVNALRTSKSEATNRSNFIDCLDRKYLIDKSRLL